jgi:hypothetical protein
MSQVVSLTMTARLGEGEMSSQVHESDEFMALFLFYNEKNELLLRFLLPRGGKVGRVKFLKNLRAFSI